MSTVAESAARPEAGVGARRLARSPLGRFGRRLPFYLLLALIFVYALFPFYWALRSAFTPETDLFKTPIQYFPAHATLTNFRNVLSSGDFQRALINSTIVGVSVTILALV